MGNVTDAPQCDHILGLMKADDGLFVWNASTNEVCDWKAEPEDYETRFDYCPKCGQRLTPTKVERE